MIILGAKPAEASGWGCLLAESEQLEQVLGLVQEVKWLTSSIALRRAT